MKPTLSVIMPAYNEEAGLASAVEEVRQYVLDVLPGSELIVVNDGSRDGTGKLADSLSQADPRVRVLHKPNGGHGSAILAGLDASQADVAFLIDSDQQIPLRVFGPMWDKLQQCDAVFGKRLQRADAAIRIWLTRVIRLVLSLLFAVSLHDSNVPCKLVRRVVWTGARKVIPDDTLAPSLFLAIWAKRSKYRVEIIDVVHEDRKTGEVSIKRWKLFKFCLRGLRQLLAFRWRLLVQGSAARG